jgi:heme oxygenase (biliverdin-producing, ferredoxin)
VILGGRLAFTQSCVGGKQVNEDPTEAPDPKIGLAALLRERTRALHRLAERTGFIRALLLGQATRDSYALYLRNLLPAYQSLEAGLDGHRHGARIGALARPELYRSASIIDDLQALVGAGWHRTLVLLPEAERYSGRASAAADGDGTLLIAHAYTRYFGDLNGGRILKRVTARSLKLPIDCLHFYEYPGIADPQRFLAHYREALDSAAHADAAAGVIAEACAVFQLNIDLSAAVQSVQVDRAAALGAAGGLVVHEPAARPGTGALPISKANHRGDGWRAR